jgi:kumamolisin
MEMKKALYLLLIALATTAVSIGGLAEDEALVKGTVISPASSIVRGSRVVHTPLYVFIPEGGVQPSTPVGETPASIACIYGVTPPTFGCPKTGTMVPTGGAKAIAVVEYGNTSTMQRDLNTFSAQWGLPVVTATVICTPGPPPCPSNAGSGWDLETSLDVQWAHAMAPNAKIIVAEFTNDPLTDGAEAEAAAAVAAAGGGEVSNSWSYDEEFSSELGLDSHFLKPGVVFFASAGDSGLGAAYPSTSPNVISAGGTHIVRDSNGNFTGESCWSGSGGGISAYEPLPNYQFIISNIARTHRGTPDLAADADPATGVAVFSTTYCGGWCQVGGTSVSSPVLAGIVNEAGGFRSSTSSELTKTYGEYRIPAQWKAYFFDITTGSNGSPAKFGWDECTGIGSTRNPAGY